MNEKGSQNFIKLDRKILDNDIMKDPLSFQLFVYCILRAEWQTVDDKGVTVPRGSFMTTIREIASDLGCTYINVKTKLRNLSRYESGYLSKLKIGRRLMVTVINYNKWQGAVQVGVPVDVPKNASLPIKRKEYKKEVQEPQWET